MAVRHRRNEKRLLKRTIAALEKQIRTRGLDAKNLSRAEGSTLGQGKLKQLFRLIASVFIYTFH